MDVKEFRTGNLLNYTTAEGDVLPSTLDWQDFKWLEEDKKGFELVHDYIPLTEKWLLDFGFEWNKETKSFEHKDFYLWHVSKSINVDIQNWQVFNYVLKAVANRNIKYVHQLQNLYFALTGEELIKK